MASSSEPAAAPPDELPRPRPVEEVLPSAELLAHYKQRIAEFEAERDELLAAVDRCAVQRDDVHRLEWENRKRADEIQELQKALSDAQQFLFEERQRLLLLQAENDELKLQELQDRGRIQQLLSMTQPLEQTVTYDASGATPPSSMTAFPIPPAGSSGAGAGKAAAGRRSGSGGEHVLRTVVLPGAVDPDFLLLKIESLQAQLAEQKQLQEERVAALLADRQLRAQEEERQRANLLVQVESLGRQVQQLEAALQAATRELISARRERQEAQAAAVAAQAQMAAEVSAARAQLAAARRAAKADSERSAAAAESKTRSYVERFREQVRARDEELTNLTSLHTATKAAAEQRIEALEGRVARLLEANRQLELRRQLDVDGWAADVTSLRRTLAVVDRKLLQMRLIDRLEDDERLDALLDQLERRVPGPQQQQQQQGSSKEAGPVAPRRPRTASAALGAGQRTGAAAKAPARGPGRAGATAAAAAAAAGRRMQQRLAVGARDQARQRPPPGAVAWAEQQRQQHAQEELAAAAAWQAEAEAAAEAVAVGMMEAEVSGLSGDSRLRHSQGASSDDGEGEGEAQREADDTASSSLGAPSSVKSCLAAELEAVRRQLAQLEARAGRKAARALAGSGGRQARRMLA